MIDVRLDDGVAVVRLDHGPVNAMDIELLQAIDRTFRDLDVDEAVEAVVLTGNDRAFGAGVDLKRILAEDAGYARDFVVTLGDTLLTVTRTVAPVVAAVNGHAVAGGAVLAAACDHALLVDDDRARVGLAELAVGVPFPTVAIELMRRRLGASLGRAVWRAELHAPAGALALGFVDEVVPADEVVERATAIARRLAAVPATTRRLTHEQLVRDLEDAVGARGSDWDGRVADVWASDAGRDAIAAFVARTL